MKEIASHFQNNENIEHDLQTPHIADFLFKSYQPSQGYPYLQRQFMEFAHLTHPEWKITDENREKITSHVYKRAVSFLRYAAPKPGQDSPDYILHPAGGPGEEEAEILKRMEDMEKIFNNEQIKDKDIIIRDIALETIRKDFDNLYDVSKEEPKSRTKKSKSELITDPTDRRYRAIADPYLSYLCYYSLTSKKGEGPAHSLGDTTLDRAFADVGDYIRGGRLRNLDWEDDAAFDVIVKLYNDTHPQNPVVWQINDQA